MNEPRVLPKQGFRIILSFFHFFADGDVNVLDEILTLENSGELDPVLDERKDKAGMDGN